MQADRFSNARDILKHLHWLPVKERIDFKILLLTFKCIHRDYLCELITHKHQGREGLRYQEGILLQEVRTKTKFGDRAFSVAAPKLWNNLPLEIRNITKIDIFKNNLKTLFFEKAFK